MTGLVLFLHGLMGDKFSWGAVPDYVRNSPLGQDFDVDTPESSAGITGRADIEKSAQKVLTEIRTKFPDHEPIYLVGHSLGGLIARDICRQLLLGEDDELLNKIPAAITVGTPMEGARFGNWILRKSQYLLKFFSPKISQLASKEYIFDEYRMAIRSATDRSVRRPKQLHIETEEDRVIAHQLKEHFTEDDSHVAVIPGTHTNFATNEKDASYVADVLLAQIRNVENSTSRPYIRSSGHAATAALPDHLVLISCSHAKRIGGDINKPDLQPAGWIPLHELRQRVISRRSYIYSILHDAKLADGFERGGNRAHQPANQGLRHGPDLGGTFVEGEEAHYLPAWQRYSGRCYSPIEDNAWQNCLRSREKLNVLIMSGLYGLIDAEEWIQNYDVHLTDSHDENGHSVSSMWSELFTECLISYVQHAHRDRKVKILDFLCDQHYADAVHWHKLPKSCSVYHFASRTLEGVELLPPAGVILNTIFKNPDMLEGLERDDRIYKISEFGVPPAGLSDAEVYFESRLGLLRGRD